MNIQISGLPENQKIKSINFNIVFDDYNVDTNTTVTIEPVKSTKTEAQISETKLKAQESVQIEPTVPTEPTEPAVPVIDISKREPKIDPNMLEESF